MKLIKKAVVVGCVVISISVQAQKSNQNKRVSPRQKTGKSYDSLIKSEQKINEYKSKDWRQGIVTVSERSDSAGKSKSRMKKKPARPGKVQAPPPPAPDNQ